MSHRSSLSALALAAAASLPLSACDLDKADPDKGIVDDSLPPGTPGSVLDLGKADDAARVLPYRIESAHPYTNNLDRTYTVDLAAVVPACAGQVKLHFSSLRTEASYDFLYVVDGAGRQVQSFTGTRDNAWTSWVTLSDAKRMSLRLVTDYSIVRDGFIVDAVEWTGAVACPAAPIQLCSADQIDLRRPAPACGCEEVSHCTPLSSVEITHTVGGGFTGAVNGKRTRGVDAFAVEYLPASGERESALGTVDREALKQLLGELASSGVLYGPGRAEPSNWTECFSITTDQESVSYCAPAGTHTALVTDYMARFDALLGCATGTLECGGGLVCRDDACVEDGCVCTALYDPVCGVDGRTYGNACTAACAGVSVRHDDECGIAGDTCGTLLGSICADGFKCRFGEGVFEAPWPDAGGTCVAQTYCDAPPDCNGLPHPLVLGNWACEANTCAWRAGEPWTQVAGYAFETAHPYANNVSTWSQLYLPAGATKMRLAMTGVFELEQGYDFLEVWTWQSGAWQRVKRYTGNVGPAASDEFPGQYHYLKFVTDSSVTRHGFAVIAQYSNL